MKNNGTTRAVNWKNGHMELGGGRKASRLDGAQQRQRKAHP